MATNLCVAVTFLDASFHGRKEAGVPEWPPSPLRLVQALLASAARRWPDDRLDHEAAPTLEWLATLPPPFIVAPTIRTGQPYQLSVPNNAMDIVGRAWSGGNLFGTGDANPSTHRTMKTVQPTQLIGGDTVRFVWPLPDQPSNAELGHLERLPMLARQLTNLGWGVDMAFGSASVLTDSEVAKIPGERWRPTDGRDNLLRCPLPGCIRSLRARHAAALRRCSEGFAGSPPLSSNAYAFVNYRRATAVSERRFAAFQLLRSDAEGLRAFSALKGCVVAGMFRHQVSEAAKEAGWSQQRIAQGVLGHGEDRGDNIHEPVEADRLAFVPIPSIEGRSGRERVVGAVRRVLLAALSGGCEAEIEWAKRSLSGRELVEKHSGEAKALLSLVPDNDRVLGDYVTRAAVWSTVTPVVLPGRDDRDPRKTERLLRKAICQAGISATLADNAYLDWRMVGYRPGVEHASRYFVPDHFRPYPRVHVRIAWFDAFGNPVEIAGPICIGGGRHYGIGLFARADA